MDRYFRKLYQNSKLGNTIILRHEGEGTLEDSLTWEKETLKKEDRLVGRTQLGT